MDISLKPGYQESEYINRPTPWIAEDTIGFMLECGVPKGATVVDIGPPSYKSKRMGEYWNVVHADAEDFNYYKPFIHSKLEELPPSEIITCFEVLEHLQNPLLFLDHIAGMMHKDGTLFLSTPSRPKFLYPEFHFHEIEPKRLQKWLLDPLGLEIVRGKRIRINNRNDWKFYIGFRPFLRLFLNFTNIYQIKFKSI